MEAQAKSKGKGRRRSECTLLIQTFAQKLQTRRRLELQKKPQQRNMGDEMQIDATVQDSSWYINITNVNGRDVSLQRALLWVSEATLRTNDFSELQLPRQGMYSLNFDIVQKRQSTNQIITQLSWLAMGPYFITSSGASRFSPARIDTERQCPTSRLNIWRDPTTGHVKRLAFSLTSEINEQAVEAIAIEPEPTPTVSTASLVDSGSDSTTSSDDDV
jgi:hypothetical protein